MHPGSSGESIPEEEYRAFFRKMFEEMGLSPEAVDSFEFFHSSSRCGEIALNLSNFFIFRELEFVNNLDKCESGIGDLNI